MLLCSRHRPQPRFPSLYPKLVGRCQCRWSIAEDPEFDFGLFLVGREQSRATLWAETTAGVAGCLAIVFKLGSRPDSEEGKGRPAFLPAVRAMANANSNGSPRTESDTCPHRHDPVRTFMIRPRCHRRLPSRDDRRRQRVRFAIGRRTAER